MSDAVRAPEAPRALGFFETLGAGLLAYLAFVLGGWLAAVALFAVRSSMDPPEAFFDPAYWDAVVWLGAFPWTLAIIWFAVRRTSWQVSDYLGLVWPRRSELVLALIVAFVVLQISSYVRIWLGATADNCVVTDYQGARSGGALFLFLATACVGAPVIEEFTVRGFLYRGWSESFLRPAGAIVLTSVFWAVCHTQYDWTGKFEIFVSGLMLGYLRYRSGSTYLTVVVHSAINLYILVFLGLALRPG